jgi:hypothetical protein
MPGVSALGCASGGRQSSRKSPNQYRDTDEIATLRGVLATSSVALSSLSPVSTTWCVRPNSSVSVRIAGRFNVRSCAQDPFWNRHSSPCCTACRSPCRARVVRGTPHREQAAERGLGRRVVAVLHEQLVHPYLGRGRGRDGRGARCCNA